MSFGERELERHSTLESRRERSQQVAVHRVELDLLGAMDALSGELTQQLLRISVRVDGNTRRCLARLVQARRVRRAELHPQLERAGEIAHGERRLVRLRDSTRERDAFGIL